jgi:hypothetical protein
MSPSRAEDLRAGKGRENGGSVPCRRCYPTDAMHAAVSGDARGQGFTAAHGGTVQMSVRVRCRGASDGWMDGRGLVAGCSFALLVVPDALFAPHDSFSLIPSLSTYPLHALPQPLQPKAIALSASCIVQCVCIYSVFYAT